MKIAIPVENGCLHGHFGGCRQFALVDVDASTKRALRTEIVVAPEHRPGLFPVWLRERGVHVVIAGGIGRRALASFAMNGIAVRAGAPGATVAQLVDAYLTGQLTATPDGCERHGHHHDHEIHHHDHEGPTQDTV
ncbi:MAG TPA: NifB/NifX family molybdenum-iron cluster-binding protein [Verrucomicrobiae bacterium]|nr:NifB/NifX family molybdenum-iron cluster-binding protein [Verrucomicrobiae bacterium]